MSDGNELCRVCGFKRSEHVATEQGPLTHPREASGEGIYTRRAFGTMGFGVEKPDEEWEAWDFVPAS